MEDRKYNQAVKADAGKLRPTLVPTQIIRDIAIVREYGNNKYGSSENWKEVEIERYRDALCRHLLAYLDDPKSVDEESGIEHYKHMACNMAFLCEMEANRAMVSIEPKRGEWIYGEHDVAMCDGYRCDRCGFFVPWDYEHKSIDFINDYHFCPHCGADMREREGE